MYCMCHQCVYLTGQKYRIQENTFQQAINEIIYELPNKEIIIIRRDFNRHVEKKRQKSEQVNGVWGF